MRKVSSILSKRTCDQRVSCAPCYVPSTGCYEGEFYSYQTIELSVPIMVGEDNEQVCEITGAGEATSCISNVDAINKASMKAYIAALTQLRDCNESMVALEDWAEVWSSTQFSRYFECPCGWTGSDSLTYQDGAMGYTVADANYEIYALLGTASEGQYPGIPYFCETP